MGLHPYQNNLLHNHTNIAEEKENNGNKKLKEFSSNCTPSLDKTLLQETIKKSKYLKKNNIPILIHKHIAIVHLRANIFSIFCIKIPASQVVNIDIKSKITYFTFQHI